MNIRKNLLAASVFYLIVFPPLIAAAVDIKPGTVPTAGEMGFPGESPVKDVPGLVGVVEGVVKYTYIIFFIIAVLFIIFAAYKYLTGANEPENVKSAHQMLIYAAIAIAIALLAISASTIIGNFLGNPPAGGDRT